MVPMYLGTRYCMRAYDQVGVWQAQDEVAMTDQLADGLFLPTKTSMGAQKHPSPVRVH